MRKTYLAVHKQLGNKWPIVKLEPEGLSRLCCSCSVSGTNNVLCSFSWQRLKSGGNYEQLAGLTYLSTVQTAGSEETR